MTPIQTVATAFLWLCAYIPGAALLVIAALLAMGAPDALVTPFAYIMGCGVVGALILCPLFLVAAFVTTLRS